MTTRAKDTSRTISGLRGPAVDMRENGDGTITASLTCYRRKANGADEEYTLEFDPITVGQAACIGRAARRAIGKARDAFVRRADFALGRVTELNEVDGL